MPAVIETHLSTYTLALGLDPLSQALREQGYRSISVGLRTAQLDGALYDLSPEAQAALASWLDGEHRAPGPPHDSTELAAQIHLARNSGGSTLVGRGGSMRLVLRRVWWSLTWGLVGGLLLMLLASLIAPGGATGMS
jgi:hypothetical protein